MIKTNPRRLMITKGVVGLTRQHLNLQAAQRKTPREIIQKLTSCSKVRREKLAHNREPVMISSLTAPLPSLSQKLEIQNQRNPPQKGSTSNRHRTD